MIGPAPEHRQKPLWQRRAMSFWALARLIGVTEWHHFGAVVVNGIVIPMLLGYYLLRLGMDDAGQRLAVLANALVLSISGPVVQVGHNWARDVQNGQLALIHSVTMSRAQYALVRISIGAVQSGLIGAAGAALLQWLFDLPSQAAQLPLIATLFGLAGLALCSASACLAQRFGHDDAARSLLSTFTLVLALCSPLVLEHRHVPAWLRGAAALLPYGPLARSTGAIFGSGRPDQAALLSAAVSGAWGVAFVTLLLAARVRRC